ncbi:MAG: hypothetical protein KAU22_11275, partial [Desulfuromonadales bacterium]|nr:hypothetical protein [Desulfuromonadales bacterium]
TQTLIYLVRNQTYFDTDVNEANIAQFKIVATYADKRHGDGSKKYIYGLTLKALKPYRWLRPWG